MNVTGHREPLFHCITIKTFLNNLLVLTIYVYRRRTCLLLGHNSKLGLRTLHYNTVFVLNDPIELVRFYGDVTMSKMLTNHLDSWPSKPKICKSFTYSSWNF